MEDSGLKDMIKWGYILYTVAGTGAIRKTQRASTMIPDCEIERKKEGNKGLEFKKNWNVRKKVTLHDKVNSFGNVG